MIALMYVVVPGFYSILLSITRILTFLHRMLFLLFFLHTFLNVNVGKHDKMSHVLYKSNITKNKLSVDAWKWWNFWYTKIYVFIYVTKDVKVMKIFLMNVEKSYQFNSQWINNLLFELQFRLQVLEICYLN